MLPYLKKQQNNFGLIVKEREPDQKEAQPEENQALKECAKDLLAAISSGSAEAVADAFEAMVIACQDTPDEGAEDESYDAQNAKAAE